MSDLASHWLSAPKNRAMYHLFQITGTALEVTLPERATEIDTAKRSLTTVSASRDGTAMSIDVGGETRDVWVPADTFTFYRRGDVASIVGRRPAQVDDRRANWSAAIALWSEWLNLDPRERQAAAAAQDRLAPAHEPTNDRSSRVPAIVMFGLGAALVALAWWLRWPPVLVGAAAGVTVLGLGENANPRRVGVAAVVAAVIAAALSLVAQVGVDAAKSSFIVLAGAVVAALSSQLVQRHLALGVVAAVIAGALLGAAGTEWIVVGIALLAFNILTTVLGADRVSMLGHGSIAVAFVVAAWVGRTAGPVESPTAEVGASTWALGLVVLIVPLLIAAIIDDGVTGTRRSLAPLALPALVAVGTFFAPGSLRVGVLSALAAALLARLLIRRVPSALTARGELGPDSAVDRAPRAQPVTIVSSVRE